ncbi:MAG: TonB-dependent receptor, partial [Pseudomonadota bacterium]
SALYVLNENANVYGRVARGFRAPSIQGRDVAFGAAPSIATSETLLSFEVGAKVELADDRIRLNGSVYNYTIDDPQLTAIGGTGNLTQLINANEGQGFGFDVDGEFIVTDNFVVTAGVSYNDTEINDGSLAVAPCGSGLCTPLDPLDGGGNALVDGNPFPQAPEWIYSLTARYSQPLGPAGNEFFVFLDFAYQGDTEFFLYESEEFNSDGNHETGLRIGYSMNDGQYEVALFGRNITDEENLKGGIDFNNLTGFVNEPRIVGLSLRANF